MIPNDADRRSGANGMSEGPQRGPDDPEQDEDVGLENEEEELEQILPGGEDDSDLGEMETEEERLDRLREESED